MKKFITICLITVATFVMHAQKKELNKEETCAYIEKIIVNAAKAAHDHPGEKFTTQKIESLNIEGKVLTMRYDDNDVYRIELNPYAQISVDYKYLLNNYSAGKWYVVKVGSDVISNKITIESDANRLKKALEHLLELLKTDHSDPFGN
jgi:hypothetical protein